MLWKPISFLQADFSEAEDVTEKKIVRHIFKVKRQKIFKVKKHPQGFKSNSISSIHQISRRKTLLLMMKVYSLLHCKNYNIALHKHKNGNNTRRSAPIPWHSIAISKLIGFYHLTPALKFQLCRDGGVEGLRRLVNEYWISLEKFSQNDNLSKYKAI